MSILPSYMGEIWKCYEQMHREDLALIEPSLVNASPELCHKDLLPFLAWECDIDISGLGEASARKVIRAAFNAMQYAGTVKSIIDVVEGFTPDARVEEWFDYAGAEFHFRVLIESLGTAYSAADLAWLESNVNKRKNVRSVLDSIQVQASIEPAVMYLGGLTQSIEIITMELS